MKKGISQMAGIAILGLLIIGGLIVFDKVITGNVVSPGSEFAGNPAEEQACMQSCVEVGCEAGDMDCMSSNANKCMAQCGARPAGLDKGEQCMQNCFDKICEQGPDYLSCMDSNRESCEEECDMKGDAPDESEMDAEQLCISNCVAKEDESVICGNSKEGETGNALCQRCAAECVKLYAGPCLNDEQLTEKEEACKTCNHCYGEPVEGASGQGWDCIVDVKCKDASSEFGDDAGTGPGIVEDIGEGIGNVVEGIGNFFKGIFGGNKE